MTDQSTSAVPAMRDWAHTRHENRENLTGKTNGWETILNTLTTHYGDRIADQIK